MSRAVALVDREVRVDERRAVYGDGGTGLPVLFLHGWGLGHRAYAAPLRRLTMRGCRVLAPSLPGFGGTASLPETDRSLVMYAAWVRDFVTAVGVTEPLLVLGHSFGGGVATRFASDYPELVRYLVLLNSMGDPDGPRGPTRWFSREDLGPGRLGAAVARELFPPRERRDSRRLAAETFARNVVRNPAALWHARQVIAAHRDLTPELAALRERRMPMLVLWGERDRVIPMTSFDVLCEAIGSEGRVVPGGHSWLLANPEAFGEVLDNLVHVESAQRVTASAAETAAALLALLHETSLPIGAVQHLVEGAAPLWLMSEPPAALATDLAMCHPPLEPAEVRAVARPAGDARTWRLTVVAHDRPGLLADTAAVLGAERLSIVSASATTWADTGLALHALSVTSAQPLDEARWASLGAALRLMSDQRPRGRFLPVGRASVTTSGGGIGRALVHITAPDQRWLLWAICSWLAANGVTIETASVATEQGEARDVFVVHGDFDPKALAERLSRMNVVDRSRAHILRPLLVPMLLPAMAVRSGLRALASRRGRRSSHL